MKEDDSAGVKSSHETDESTLLTDGGQPADRWPSATEWMRVDDDGTHTWRTSRGHRESRGYER